MYYTLHPHKVEFSIYNLLSDYFNKKKMHITIDALSNEFTPKVTALVLKGKLSYK